MKVLQIINSLSSGGAEVFATSLAIAQKQLGADVSVFTYCGAIDEKGQQLQKALADADIAHHSPILKRNLLKPAIPLHLAQLMNRIRPDICHSHLEQSDFFLALTEKLIFRKVRKVRTIHNVYAPSVLPTMAHRWLSTSFDRSIACGPAVRAQYPFLRNTDIAINNGIDLSRLLISTDNAEIRSNLKIASHELLLVHIGAFAIRDGQLQKSQDVIVSALAKTLRNDYIVAFLGDGDQRPVIEKLAKDLGVDSRCRFLGRVTNPIDYIFAADGVLMPSRFEGLSIGCIEAVCTGRPVIASDIAAFSPFKRESTLFVKAGDSEHLADRIDYFLKHNAQLLESAKKYCPEYCAEFDIKSVASRYLREYEKVTYGFHEAKPSELA